MIPRFDGYVHISECNTVLAVMELHVKGWVRWCKCYCDIPAVSVQEVRLPWRNEHADMGF